MPKKEKREEIISLLMASMPYALEVAEENPMKSRDVIGKP